MTRSMAKDESENDDRQASSFTVGLLLVFVEFIGENRVFAFEFFDDAAHILHVHSLEILDEEGDGACVRNTATRTVLMRSRFFR